MPHRYSRTHYLTEHIWRALRAVLILSGTIIWLYTSFQLPVLILFTLAVLVDQFRGFICTRIERFFNWEIDFDERE